MHKQRTIDPTRLFSTADVHSFPTCYLPRRSPRTFFALLPLGHPALLFSLPTSLGLLSVDAISKSGTIPSGNAPYPIIKGFSFASFLQHSSTVSLSPACTNRRQASTRLFIHSRLFAAYEISPFLKVFSFLFPLAWLIPLVM